MPSPLEKWPCLGLHNGSVLRFCEGGWMEKWRLSHVFIMCIRMVAGLAGTEQGLLTFIWKSSLISLSGQMLLVHAEKSMGQRLWLTFLKQLLWNIHIQERGKYSLVSIQAHRLHSDRLLSRWIILISVPYIFLENVILPQQGSTSCTLPKFCGNINTVLWQSVPSVWKSTPSWKRQQ